MPDERGDEVAELLRADEDLAVLRVELLGDHPGPARLVELRPEIVGDREGADVLDPHLVHQGDDGARIDPAGEEDAEGDVAAELQADGVAQQAGGALDALLLAQVLGRDLQVPVLAELRAVAVDAQAPAGLELLDAAEEGALGRDVADAHVGVEHFEVDAGPLAEGPVDPSRALISEANAMPSGVTVQ